MGYEVEMVDRTKIIPYPNNPRKINDNAVNAVAESIKNYGWRQPIVVDRHMVVIAGHTRLRAAEKLDIKQVPCIVARDLSEEEAMEYRLVDNKSGEKAVWDFEKLQVELKQIDLTKDVIAFNWSHIELDTIMQAAWAPSPVAEEDEEDSGAKEDEESASGPERHTITLNKGQYMQVMGAMTELRQEEPELTDGECIERICTEWLGS